MKIVNKPITVDTNAIVIIEWMDAQCDSEWDEITEPELAKCITVGFLIAENKKAICLASTWTDPFSNARMHIPKAWIISRKSMSINSIPAHVNNEVFV